MTDVEFRSDVTVELVKYTASDLDVLSAARVSTVGQASDYDISRRNCEHEGLSCQWSQCGLTEKDKGLINYLMRDRHGSPFEHNSMTFFISAPIFVFREFMRHRVGWSYNEESGRYRQLEPVFYIPDTERKLVQTGKPGAYVFEHGDKVMPLYTHSTMRDAYEAAYDFYTALLLRGIAREVARMVLPVGTYSSMYATCNARSLMHFLSLRTQHKDASVPSFPQREIEMVGEKMESHFSQLMPLTHAAYNANGRIAP